MEVDINDLASLGVINDVRPYQLPPEAWTTALNMRYRDSAVESLRGWESVFQHSSLVQSPHFLMPVSTQEVNYWLWASLNKIWVWNGVAHADISRAVGGPYSTQETRDWNGTILGGIPIFNNGVDIPQYRSSMAPGTQFANLLNWPSDVRARVMRAFGPYLLAFNIIDSGGLERPHMVWWSHPADPGSVPISWNPADPTKDAGQKEFEDVSSGVIVDALPLQGIMYIYKEAATWMMRPIGGKFIFDFKTLFETSGILAPRCVAITGDGTRHVVVTQEDMIWHNGNRVMSILNQRQRSRMFGEMDTNNYQNSFLFPNPLANEMWFCYPTTGNVQPNKALVWNYKEGGEVGAISYVDGITFRNASLGSIEAPSSEIWDFGTETWDSDMAPWGEFLRRRVIVCGTDAMKFYNLDKGATKDGVEFDQVLQRVGLSVLGRKRSGQWIVDHQRRKVFQRLWPKVTGGSVNIRLGAQELVDGPILWGEAKEFDPTKKLWADNDPVSGSALAVEYSSRSTMWRIDGYKAVIEALGMY